MASDDNIGGVGGNNTVPPDSKSSNILLNQPIVIDNGTSTVKAGFAGGSKPKVS